MIAAAAFTVVAAVAALWILAAAQALRAIPHSRFAQPFDPPPGSPSPHVSAIVPAHNEAAHIGETVRGLIAQTAPNLSILIVDDQSTDQTAQVVEQTIALAAPARHPIELLRGRDRPAGWVGKTWALSQGVEQADGEWLWMVDADLHLHPQVLATALEIARRDQADFVSFLSRPRCTTFWQTAVAEFLVWFLALLYPLRKVNDPRRSTALSHGAFVLIRRDAYDHAGGIESVRQEIVEDIRFAERVKASGGRLSVHPAPQLSQTHMYGSLADIVCGLRKNAFAGMDYQLHKYATGSAFGLIVLWTPIAALAVGAWSGLSARPIGAIPWWAWLVAGGLGWLAQAVAVLPTLAFLGRPWPYAIALPLGGTAYVGITTVSVLDYLRGTVRWKDRAFEAPQPSAHRGL